MLKSWLKRPFPYIESRKEQFFISLIAGLIVVIFLLIFQPFEIDIQLKNVILYLSGFGLITTGGLIVSFIIFPIIFSPWMKPEDWSIGKNLLFIAWILLLITLCNYFYGQFLGNNYYQNQQYYDEHNTLASWFFMTFTIGIFPITIIVYYAERKLLQRNTRIAKELSLKLTSHKASPISKQIRLELNKTESLEIPEADIIAVKAEGGNYSTVYWIEEEKLKTALVRITLSSFLNLLSDKTRTVRCHKSYIVNLVHIRSINGNARSLMLSLTALEDQVPVSRSFPRKRLIIED